MPTPSIMFGRQNPGTWDGHREPSAGTLIIQLLFDDFFSEVPRQYQGHIGAIIQQSRRRKDRNVLTRREETLLVRTLVDQIRQPIDADAAIG